MRKRLFALFMILALLVCLLPVVAMASGRSARPGPRSMDRPIPTLVPQPDEELSAEAEETVVFLPPRSDAEAEDAAENSVDEVTAAADAADAYLTEAAEGFEIPDLLPPEEEPVPEEPIFEESASVEPLPVEPQEPAPVETNPAPPEETEESLAEAKALAEQILPDGPVKPESDVSMPDAEDEAADAETSEDEAADAPKQVIIGEDESVYAYEGTVVFNNGGTVYNNGALVYNNAGTVYSNAGTVYNNAGIVYANEGSVYNNNGTVYNNGAFVHGFIEGSVVESRIFGYYALHFAEYYDPYITVEGTVIEPDGGNRMVLQDKECRITPDPGFTINSATASNCKLVWNGDGSISLIDLVGEISAKLELQASAPIFMLASGTYAQPQTVCFDTIPNCEILYTDDGSMPGAGNGMVYVEPFTVSSSSVITAVASPQGAKMSEPVRITLAFPQFTAPVFAPVEEDYGRVEAKPVTVKADMQAVIKGVALDGPNADCFVLSTGDGRLLERGAVNTATWTVQPVTGLSEGVYEAAVVFTLESGETVSVPVQFIVQAAAGDDIPFEDGIPGIAES